MSRAAACPDVRHAILEAATALMERFGFRKMTIDDIAQEAGIGKATIYGYFENKQEVGLAVIENYQSQVRARQRSIVALDLEPGEKLRRVVVERVMSAFDIASRYRQSLDDSLAALKPLVLRRRGRYGEEEAQLVSAVIEEGVEQRVFHTDDPLDAARTILTCVGGLMPYSLSPRELNERQKVLEQTNRVIELVLGGLQGESAGTPEPRRSNAETKKRCRSTK